MRLRPRAADLLTAARFLLTPFVLLCAVHRSWGAAFCLFAAACLTDLLDGPLARAAGGGGLLGAILDLAADLALILPLALILSLRGLLPPLLPTLAAVSFLAYSAACLAKGRVARHRIGKYAGAVCAAGLGAILCMEWLGLGWLPSVVTWSTVAACLLAATIESAVHLARTLAPFPPRHGGSSQAKGAATSLRR